MGIVPFDLYNLVRGPAFLLTTAVFVAGMVFRAAQFARMTRKVRVSARPAAAPAAPADTFLQQGRSALSGLFIKYRRWERGTIFHTHPVMSRVSVVFHILLFLSPLLLPAHNILAYQTLGVSIFTVPEPVLDWFTVIVIAGCVFFLARRLAYRRVRLLTQPVDFVILALVAAPFVTAYLAYHQFFSYRTVLLVHMIIGEIVIMAIPFTKLGHMPFLIFARFFVRAEYAIGRGSRRW